MDQGADHMMALFDPLGIFLHLFNNSDYNQRTLRDGIAEKQLLSDFQRIELTGTDTDGVHIYDIRQTSKQLIEALTLRKSYMSFSCQRFPDTTSRFLKEVPTTDIQTKPELFKWQHGVVFLYENQQKLNENQPLSISFPDTNAFIQDYTTMFNLINDGPLRSFCSTRLCFLSTKFSMHILVNSLKEAAAQKVLSRIDFNRVMKIQHMVLYEVQYGNRKQIGTALVIGSGTENEMVLQKNERECQTSPEPTPRSPTPPPSPAESIEIPLPGSPSLPIIRRPAKGKRSTKIPKPKPTSKKSTKPLAKVLSRGMPPTTPQSSIPGPTTVSLSPTNSTSRPTTSGSTTNPTSRPTTSGPTTNSNSRPTTSGPTTNPTPRPTTSGPTTNPTSRPTTSGPTTNSTSRPRPLSPPTSPQIIVHQQPHLQSPQPPSPATPSVNHRSIFPDDHRVFHVLDTILRGVTRLNMKVTDIDNRLKTLEAKHDIHHEESRRGKRQETPWSAPPADSDDGSEATHTIAHPAGMVIDQDRLLTLKGKSQSAGNFAALVIRELKPHLFGPENLRQLYNWNGGGVNGKRGLSPNTKTAVSNYTTMFYPECQKEDYFRDTVIQKINESLRRPAVKRCRRRLLETPLNTINNDANHI